MRVKLEDVCERGSSNLKQSDIIDATGDYPIYGASGYIGNIDFYHQDKPYVAVVKDGAGIGRTTLHPAKSSVIGTMQYLLPKENVLPEYLCYVVRYMHLEKYFTGATIPHIYFKDYKNEQFNLDSLERQAEIVDILGKCERVIASREDELQQLDELIKARFIELFGDLEKNTKGYKKEALQKHADVYVGYPFKSEGYTEEGVGIVGGYNLMQGFIVWKDCKYWPDTEGYEQYLLKDKDIVMAMDRPWVNGGFKIAFIDEDHLPALLIQRTACIRGRDVEQEFLFALLNSNWFSDHCNITGSLVPHISHKDINSYEIILPPIEEQKLYSEFVKQVNKSKVIVMKMLLQVFFMNLRERTYG